MDDGLKHRTSLIRRHVTESLGFDLVGFARAEPMDEQTARYRDWLARGHHGSMAWMERNVEKRLDVRELLPNALSVIVVAKNYYTPHTHSPESGHARISRYAWGRDYHKILPKKLKLLDKYLRSLDSSATSRWYVDTGPIMEKPWAVRAGLGWMGKHTNLITRSHGSWVFLGVLITTLPLNYDAPIADFCGECTACLDACPTDAFAQPYVLDATKCISYITIEQRPKEELPGELGAKFGGWIFGCDICQDVCPWNRFEQPTDEAAFAPRQGMLELSLDEVIAMSDEEFHRRFDGTPVTRAKAGGLRRNARGAGGGRRRVRGEGRREDFEFYLKRR